MDAESPSPPIPWAFVITLLVVGAIIGVAIIYWGAGGHLGHPIPGTHSP